MRQQVFGGGLAGRQVDREHSAEVPHLALGEVVLRVCVQARVVHGADCRVALQRLGEVRRAGRLVIGAHGQSAHTAQRVECIER